MEYYWNVIKNHKLNNIFIPGTHDSVSDENVKLPKGDSHLKDKTLQAIFSKPGFAQFAMTQVD